MAGSALLRFEGEVPSIRLLKSGAPVIWREQHVPCMLSVAIRREDPAAGCTSGLKEVSVLVEGLRLLLDHGVVTDLSNFAADLFGLQSFGQDVALIISETMKAMALSRPQARAASPSAPRVSPGLQTDAEDYRDNAAHCTEGFQTQPEKLRAVAGARRRQSALDTLSTAICSVSTGVGGVDTSFQSLSSHSFDNSPPRRRLEGVSALDPKP